MREANWRPWAVRCAKHPNRQANRSAYVRGKGSLCSTCLRTRADGTLRPAFHRAYAKYRATPWGRIYRHRAYRARMKFLADPMPGGAPLFWHWCTETVI
jgi:hypothetical protein